VPARYPAAAAAVVVALALASPASARNAQLAGLQVALRAHGLYCGPIDGISGPATAAAIRAFQQKAHLPVDGIPGPRTRAKLGPLGRPLFGRRTITSGAFGWDVSVLQFLLRRRGVYGGPIDGHYGARTAAALRRYQSAAGLAADGIAGPATSIALARGTRAAARSTPSVALASSSGSSGQLYVVRAGDNLTLLAQRFGLSLGGLASANGIDPAKPLIIGTKLRIRTLSATSSAPASVPTASASSVRDALGVWATHYGVDPQLARALSWQESGFQEDIRSSVGAWGPMQLLPVTWDYVVGQLIRAPVPKTAAGNVQVGMAYLKHLLDNFGGDKKLALAAWYQGEKAVRDNGVYAETKQFVANVLALESRM
jgi:peptidoglycan hydrolase-like protein with peptidoglycan-binding domain